MIIGIIGAGIAGLTAGRHLARHGHEVIVLEKSNGFGGRLTSHVTGPTKDVKVDHGVPFISSGSAIFSEFISELKQQGLIREWTDTFSLHTSEEFYPVHPSKESEQTYVSSDGMHAIGKYLSRWMDFRLNQKVGGITMVAPGKLRKRPWVVNFSDSTILELDALIIATPAIAANGVLQTAQDELAIRYLTSLLAKVKYDSTYTLMAGYGKREIPEWKGIYCQNRVLGWVSNESSKRDTDILTLTAQTNAEYTTDNMSTSQEQIINDMLRELGSISGSWAANPEWRELHFWQYFKCVNPMDESFLESFDNNCPLALVGDYLGGNSVESAYLSGLRLAEHWLNKFPNP